MARMANEEKFARVEAGLEGVLEELREREPIFHRAAFGRTREEMERVTRRMTVWERRETGWRIVFHQGTVVTAEDDTMPEAV